MDNLIIVRTHGARPSMYPLWVQGDPKRNWDLYVCPYAEKPAQLGHSGENMPGYVEPAFGEAKTTIGDVIPGHKMIGLRTLLNSWSDWRSYKYIMLSDDDLFAMPGTWSRFFNRVTKYNAKLAQAALTEDSFFSFGFTIRNTEFVARRVSYVQDMMPCFRVDVLTEFLPTFDQATEMGNGWGLDYLWAERLGHKDIFIIDETPVTHSRPGNFTAERFAAGQQELRRISGKQFGQWVQRSYAGIDRSGNEIRETDPRFLDRLMRGYRTLFERDCSAQNPVRQQERNIRNRQTQGVQPAFHHHHMRGGVKA